jgi:dTDP-4-dehydrorhamnose reductase
LALEINPCTVILRTSWVYSEFGKNFVKTMLNLFSTKEELGIVADQFGQPTNANDLAEAIMKIVCSEKITPEFLIFLIMEKFRGSILQIRLKNCLIQMLN